MYDYIFCFHMWKMCYYSHLDKGALKPHCHGYLEKCSLINCFQVYLQTYCKYFKWPILLI